MSFWSVRHLLRWSGFLIVCAIMIYWLVTGYSLVQKAGDSASPEKATKYIIRKLEVENPDAAAELTRLRERNDIRAVSAVLRDADNRGGAAGLQRLVDRKLRSGKIPYELRLASLAVDPNLLAGRRERDEFLWAHLSALQLLDQDPTGRATDAYLGILERAASVPDLWRVAKDNSVAMLVCECISDPTLRAYYEQGQDWLDVIIVDVVSRADMADNDKQTLVSYVVKTAYDNRPYFKQAIIEHEFDAQIFFLFAQHGEVVRRAVGTGGLPLEEVLEVIYANGDYFKIPGPEDIVGRLVYIRNHKPSVWRAARRINLALWLNEHAPQCADQIFERYPGDDIATLLYAGYENEVVYAAEAIAKFGDLATYILNRYVESRPFHEALKRPNAGPRLIPYVATFGDPGIERLEKEAAWLDKYFDLDGTPREEEWWTQIPGGAAAKLAKNLMDGYPNEWNELGWAALDVADAALAVASFGESEVLIMSAKKGGGEVLKQVGKEEAKRQVLRAGQRRASFLVKGAREAARKESRSLLRRAVAQGTRLARVGIGMTGKAWRFTLAAARPIVVPAEQILEAAKKFRGSWRSVPFAYRKIIYRSLLAVGLLVTVKERTLPALSQIGEAAGRFVGDVVKNAADATAAGLRSAIEEAFGSPAGEVNRWLYWITYLVGFIVLGALSWKLCPVGKGKLRYV